MATYEVQVDFGSGPQDLTDYLIGQHPVKRSRSIHSGLKPVIGTCEFMISRDLTVINQFLISSIDPVVTITKNSAAYFKGTIRRTVKVSVGQLRVDALKCQCVDPLYRMDGRKIRTSFVWKNYKICNPATKSQSILHQLFYLAGYTDSELNLSLVDTSISNYAIDGTKSALEIRGLIETVLRDCVHSLTVLPTGVISLYNLAPVAFTTTGTLATGAGGNIVGGYSIGRDEFKSEAVDVTYWDHLALTGAVLFEDTTGAAPGVDCSIPVPAGTYFPEGASASVAIRCVFDVKDYELVSAESAVIDWSYTGAVTKQVETLDGMGMLVRFYSSTGGVITKFRIVGNATVKKNQNKVSVEIVSSSDEREEIKTEILTSAATAGFLAAGRATWHKNSIYQYTMAVLAATELDPGQIVTLSDPNILGASQLLRVVRIDDGDDEKQYKIACEGVAVYSATAIDGTPVTAKDPIPGQVGPPGPPGADADAAKVLSLSASSATRSRVGTLTPGSLTIAARKQDGTTYAGRFKIDISHDGVTYTNDYLSAADESDYVYTIPVDMFIDPDTWYVVSVRVELYSSGVDGNFLARQSCSISVDGNTAPIYWGAITTAPTADFLPGDYYWDNNDSGVGTGGTPRIYNGSAWVEFTSAMPGYGNAMMAMLADMGAWATAQGEAVAAASALFAKLVTADAFIANLFAQQITVGSGGRIQYETGSGVQKRAVRLHDEKIDWIDTPDTSPASPEVLRARIGRLGVGGNILLDGGFNVLCNFLWDPESTVNAAKCLNPDIIQQTNGTLRVMYLRFSDRYLVQRTSTNNGVTWSAESTVNAAITGSSSLVQQADGTLRVVYTISPSGNLVQRTSTNNGVTWSAESSVNAASTGFPNLIQRSDSTLHVVYRLTSTGRLLQRTSTNNGVTWSAESTVNGGASTSPSPSMIQQADGTLRVVYTISPSGNLVQRTSTNNGVTWSAESTVNAANSGSGNLIQQVDGTLRVVYRLVATDFLVQRTSTNNGVTWSAESSVNAAISSDPRMIQQVDGTLRVVYWRAIDGYILQRTLQRYAQLGAGIIETGQNTNGSYIKFSDGTMQCWSPNLSANWSSNYLEWSWTFPAPYIAQPMVSPHFTFAGSAVGQLDTRNLPSATVATFQIYSIAGTKANPNYCHAIAVGRWK